MPHPVYVSLYHKFLNKDKDYLQRMHIYRGLIRHHYEKYKEYMKITSDFIDTGCAGCDYPKNFFEKCLTFLTYLYENGGSEYKSFNFTCNDYALAYSEDNYDFQNIIEYLIDDGKIEHRHRPAINSARIMINFEIRLTIDGIKYVERELPVVPLGHLINENIFTYNKKIDDSIKHAKKLFFKENSTKDDKRSACEALSFVLEPIREELKKVLTSSDVSDFFEIVNTFDIRHNKESTKSIQHEEQLEWIFYSLLNSIICYYKLWKK